MGLVWFGIVGFFYLREVFLVEFVGLDDLGGFLVMLAIPPQKKKSVQMDVGSLRNVLCNCYHIFRRPRGLS